MKLGVIVVVDDSNPQRRFVQTMCPPLGVLSLQACLAERQPEVELFYDYDPEKVLKRQPDIIGLSSVTENFGAAVDLAARLRQRSAAPCLMGGTHISLLPELLPDACDVGVIGEAEDTLPELLQVFARHGAFPPEELAGIAGIVYRHPRQGLQRTAPRPPVRPLDRIPFPNRRTLDPADCVHLMTSRGCTGRCAFCSSPALWPCFRQYSAGAVVEELARLRRELDPPVVKFMDDLWVADRRRVKDIARRLADGGIAFRRGFSAFARVNLLDEALVKILRKMGVTRLSLGIESGSQRILDRLDKQASVALNQQALDLCTLHGIRVCCSFVIGVPGETVDDLSATLDFIERNGRNMAEIEICPLVPFPGTPLWDDALRRDLVGLDMDWSRLRDHSDFTQFDPDTYLYLNPAMPRKTFAECCRRFRDVYQEISRVRNLTVTVQSRPLPGP
jgi:radical SAM superfamily enzyme YgiQ (UPF0313 family)